MNKSVLAQHYMCITKKSLKLFTKLTNDFIAVNIQDIQEESNRSSKMNWILFGGFHSLLYWMVTFAGLYTHHFCHTHIHIQYCANVLHLPRNMICFHRTYTFKKHYQVVYMVEKVIFLWTNAGGHTLDVLYVIETF